MNNKGRTRNIPTVMPAEITESDEAAELIYLTGERIFKYLFYTDVGRTVAVIRQLFEMEDNDFSHKYAYTAKLDRQIAGLIVFLDRIALTNNHRKMGWKIVKVMGLLPFAGRLPRFIRADRLVPKILDHTLYINHIAVTKEYRGRGVAAHLLDYGKKQAESRGLTRLALDVEVVNDRAIRVYEKFGFEKTKKVENKVLYSEFGFSGLYRMEKEIGS